MEKQNCRVIYNPVTSGFSEKKLDEVCYELDKKYEVEKAKSEYKGHAIEISRKSNQDSDLTISYGGDGTFGELITGIYNDEQKTIISHIPIGTANDLQKNFGLVKDPAKSAALIRDGKVIDYDIFTINGVPFSYVGAFGYFANVPCNTPTELKKKYKYLAYLLVALKEFKEQKPIKYDMTLFDGQNILQEEAIIAAFSNSTGFGGMDLFNGACIDDGKFEVTLIKDVPKLKMPKIAFEALTGRLDMNKYTEYFNHFNTSELTIKFNNGEPKGYIDLDGDPAYVSNKNDVYKLKLGKKIKLQIPNK